MSVFFVVLAYLTCSVLTYGIYMADFWESFQILNKDPYRWGELSGRACVLAAFGPLGLLTAVIGSGFCRHGLLFRKPK